MFTTIPFDAITMGIAIDTHYHAQMVMVQLKQKLFKDIRWKYCPSFHPDYNS